MISKTEVFGPEFKILGAIFDSALRMASDVAQVVTEARWKLRMLIKTRRYCSDAELVTLCKTHLLSYPEYKTQAVFHATRESLERLDGVQTKFLQDACIDVVTALMQFNLAPLAAWRDMARHGDARAKLPGGITSASNVATFQSSLQLELKLRAEA